MVTWSSTRELKPSSGKKTAFSTNGAGTTGSYHVEECESIYSYFFVQTQSNWIKELHIKPETLKFLEEKVGKSLEDKGTGEKFLNRTAMALKNGKLLAYCKNMNFSPRSPTPPIWKTYLRKTFSGTTTECFNRPGVLPNIGHDSLVE